MSEIFGKPQLQTQGKYLAVIAASLMAENAKAERRSTLFSLISILSVLLILVSLALENKIFLYFSIFITIIFSISNFYEFIGTQRKAKEFDEIGDAARMELQLLFHRSYGIENDSNPEISSAEMKVLLKLREASNFKESKSLFNLFWSRYR